MTRETDGSKNNRFIVFDFEAAVQRCWKRRLLLLPYTIVCVVLGIVYMHVAEPSYTVKATVAPTQDQAGALQGVAAGLLESAASSGLGSLLGSSSDDHFQAFLALLQSNRLSAKLAAQKGFLQTVFYKRWDPDSHQWDNGPLRKVAKAAKSLLGLPVKVAPDADDLYDFLNDDLVIKRSFQNSLVEVDLNFVDPESGERILNAVLSGADSIIRQDNYRDVDARLRYLQKQLPTITVSDQRQAIITLLSGQQQSMMMIRADALYASTLIETPHAPNKPSWPNLALVLFFSIVFALGLWVATALLLRNEIKIATVFRRAGTSPY